jgi:MFS family permease
LLGTGKIDYVTLKRLAEAVTMSGQFGLLKTRRFAPLFGTQFLGAFNDNLFKNALIVLLTFQSAQWTTLAPELLANLAAGIFILPFFLFSATAGQLADKYDKALLARLVKVLEMVIMGVAAPASGCTACPC